MSKDVSDAIGTAIGHAARNGLKRVAANSRKRPQLSGPKAVAAGFAGAGALMLLTKGLGKQDTR